MNKGYFQALLIITMFFAFSNVALAYAYMGSGKWSSSTVNYAIDTSVPSSYDSIIEEAADWWTTSTDINLVRNSNSTINVYAYDYGQTGWDGYSNMNPDWNSAFSYGNFQLNTYYTSSYSSLRLKLVSAHEFGHELSLDHVYGYNIMYVDNVWVAYQNNSNLQNGPQQDDIDGVNARY